MTTTTRCALLILVCHGQTGSNNRRKKGTDIETVPFQNPSRNSKHKRLIFQHSTRAVSDFQKDLVFEGRAGYLNNRDVTQLGGTDAPVDWCNRSNVTGCSEGRAMRGQGGENFYGILSFSFLSQPKQEIEIVLLFKRRSMFANGDSRFTE